MLIFLTISGAILASGGVLLAWRRLRQPWDEGASTWTLERNAGRKPQGGRVEYPANFLPGRRKTAREAALEKLRTEERRQRPEEARN